LNHRPLVPLQAPTWALNPTLPPDVDPIKPVFIDDPQQAGMHKKVSS
jgi:hypothetical protein